MRSSQRTREIVTALLGYAWTVHPDFPDYFIREDGAVLSTVRSRPVLLRSIRCGAYEGFTLRSASGVLRRIYKHRLLAEAWYGPCPPGYECRHLDGDRRNNHWTNLRWGTHTENMGDARRHGTGPQGERNAGAKLTWADVAALRSARAETGASFGALAAQFGVTTMTAWRAVKGRAWKN